MKQIFNMILEVDLLGSECFKFPTFFGFLVTHGSGVLSNKVIVGESHLHSSFVTGIIDQAQKREPCD